MGDISAVDDALAAGRLVKPFDISLPGDWAHYVVCPEARTDRPKIRAFRDWLMEAAGATAS